MTTSTSGTAQTSPPPPEGARTWASLSWPSRLALVAVMVAGAGALVWHGVALRSSVLDGTALVFILLALAAGSLTVRLPFVRASFSLDTVFVFAMLLTGNPHVAVVSGGAAMALGELRSGDARRPWHVVPFNFASGALSAAAAHGMIGLVGQFTDASMASDAAALTFGYYAANVLLVSLAVATTRGLPLGKVVGKLAWTFPAFFGATSIAALVVAAMALAPVAGVLVVPLLVALYAGVVAHRERAESEVRHEQEVEQLYLPTVAAISSAIEARESADGGHHTRVQALALALAEELKITDGATLKAVRFGALLHDVGRIALPDALLLKADGLSPAERAQLELHSVIGAELVRHIPFDAPVADTIRHHHERWDGQGYPDGLAGAAIPLAARLTGVAEAFDSMTSASRYARARTVEAASAEVVRCAGTHFDPEVAAALPGALARLARTASHEPATDATDRHALAIDVIAEGALAHGLELRLSRALQDATTLNDALVQLRAAIATVLPVQCATLVELANPPRTIARTDEAPPAFCLAAEQQTLVAPQPLDGPAMDPAAAVLLPVGLHGIDVSLALCLDEGAHLSLLSGPVTRALIRPLADAITRIRKLEASERRASTDALTGIANRLAYEDARALLATELTPVGVLLLDLDGFKGVNDHFGHAIGDDALRVVGRCLQAFDGVGGVRSFRNGGDEFVILLQPATQLQLDALAQQVVDAIEAVRLPLNDDELLPLRTSVGGSVGVPAERGFETMLEEADVAMYAFKQARPGRLPRGARPVTLTRRAIVREVGAGRADEAAMA